MALYLGSKKVAGNTTSESLDDDVKDYKVTFDDSGEVDGITDMDTFMSSFKSKLQLANLFSIIKAGFKIIKDNIANLTTSSIKSTDTEGLLGTKNADVITQDLIDEIANRVVNELVTNQNLTNTLSNYVSKIMISTSIENNSNKVASTSLVSQLNSDLNSLSGLFQYTPFCGTFIYDGEATEIITVNEPRITDENWRIIATCQDAGDLAVKQIGNITSGSFRVYFDSEIAITRINYFAFYQA